jgi:hypothetical protein
VHSSCRFFTLAINSNLIISLQSAHAGILFLAVFLGDAVDEKHIFRMSAQGRMLSIHFGQTVCFNPPEIPIAYCGQTDAGVRCCNDNADRADQSLDHR